MKRENGNEELRTDATSKEREKAAENKSLVKLDQLLKRAINKVDKLRGIGSPLK